MHPDQAHGRRISRPAGAAQRLGGRAWPAASDAGGQRAAGQHPGSAPLESSALLGFLPAISRHLLGEELAAARPAHLVVRASRRHAARAAPPQEQRDQAHLPMAQANPPRWATPQPQGTGWAGCAHPAPARRLHHPVPPATGPDPTWTGGHCPRSAILRVYVLAMARNPGACCPVAWCGLARAAS